MITQFIVAEIRMNEYLDNLAIANALQAQHMPSLTEEIFTEIARNINIRWNLLSCIESIHVDAKHIESIAHRTPVADVVITNSALPLFCREL
jgi:hypothetical protein